MCPAKYRYLNLRNTTKKIFGNLMKFSTSIQKMVPFGYLFLVILGILKESVYYYQIGINILKYSTIMDILISPIADLTSHPMILAAVIFVFLIAYTLPAFLSKQSHRKWGKKLAGLKKNREELTEEEVEQHFTNMFIRYLAVGLLSFFVGIGIGGGIGLAKKIAGDKLHYNCKMTFDAGEPEDVFIAGSNSAYYFLFTKGSKTVKIVPAGAIKRMEMMK